MTNFLEPDSIGSQEPFPYRLQSCLYSSWWIFRDALLNPSLQGWNIFGYPILVIDTGCQEPRKWNLRRIIGLLYITNIVAVKEIGGNPCVMGASLVWPKDVASVGIVSVHEGYQVGFQTVIDVRTCGDIHTFSWREHWC